MRNLQWRIHIEEHNSKECTSSLILGNLHPLNVLIRCRLSQAPWSSALIECLSSLEDAISEFLSSILFSHPAQASRHARDAQECSIPSVSKLSSFRCVNFLSRAQLGDTLWVFQSISDNLWAQCIAFEERKATLQVTLAIQDGKRVCQTNLKQAWNFQVEMLEYDSELQFVYFSCHILTKNAHWMPLVIDTNRTNRTIWILECRNQWKSYFGGWRSNLKIYTIVQSGKTTNHVALDLHSICNFFLCRPTD